MTRPAVRDFDKSSCTEHGGGMTAALQDGVNTNRMRAATAKCPCACMGPPDYIVTGSGTVLISSTPAARSGDKTLHGGAVLKGSGDVLIGGPTVGVTLGAPGRGRSCCEDLKAGRSERSPKQGYSNCGLESSRLLIRAKHGSAPTENELMDEAIRHDEAEAGFDIKSKRWMPLDEWGGQNTRQTESLLRRHGVETEKVEQAPGSIIQAVAEGKGVITSHEASVLWDDPDNVGGHAVVVTGVEFDADGKPVAYVTVDSAKGQCARRVPADRFEDSLWKPPATASVTTEPLWPNARSSP
jgi:uncharacterized Zn-binding protein involved in type VI secretion